MNRMRSKELSDFTKASPIDRRTFLGSASMAMAAYAVSPLFVMPARMQGRAAGAVAGTSEPMDRIKTEHGYISGMMGGQPGREVCTYRGVPYAAPPVGELRWEPPQPAKPWDGVRRCTEYSLEPAQYPARNPVSEDSLYLNVTTPAKKVTEKLPVMFWIHGGAFNSGSGNGPLYNALGLPQHGVVLVTVNGRLGITGLLAHPLLSKESPNDVSGNYLFLDLIAALKWVKRNIAAFGGDPDNVTIFGESGGGMKVVALMSSPLSEGLFHKAITESGGLVDQVMPMKEQEVWGERLFAKLGVDKGQDPLAAARAVSWEKLVEADQALRAELAQEAKEKNIVTVAPPQLIGAWKMVVDGWFMPDTTDNIFRAGKQHAVPFITLANLGELTTQGPGYSKLVAEYVIMLSGMTKTKAKGYAGIFDQVPINWRQEGRVAVHASEMPYMFGALDEIRASNAPGRSSAAPVITDADRSVSEALMRMWTQFAKTGNPSVRGLIEWPPYGRSTDEYLYVTEPLQVRAGFSKVLEKKQ
jgi:para-nitrobenzyl esterase